MKHTRLVAALVAVFTAVMPLTSNVHVTVPCTAYAEGSTITDSVDWIPKSFDAALEFRNTYGAVHIEDGILCVVFQREYEPLDTKNLIQFERYNFSLPGYNSTVSGYDMRSYTHSDNPVKGEKELYVIALSKFSKGEFSVEMEDRNFDSSVPDQRYSFSVDDRCNIIETDIYSWLPDCEKEYWEYAEKNGHLSVKDNYVVFCLSHEVGTGYGWTLRDEAKECFELGTVSDCTPMSAASLDGGQINTIYAYKAVKDGYDKISYNFGAGYASVEEDNKTLTADCVVINNAQNILLSGDMKVTLVDRDTEEILTISDGTIPRIWTNISQSTPEGEIYCNMQPIGFRTNPAIVRLGNFFDGYNFSFGLDSDDLPVGYSLPDSEDNSVGYYNGTIRPDDYVTIKKYDNNTADVVFRLKKQQDIPKENTIRFKLIDADNGKTLRIDDYDYPFGLSADISYFIENQALPYFISKDFTVDSNPYSLDLSDEVFSGLKIDKISRFDTILHAVPSSCDIRKDDIQTTVYDNNSMDVIVPIRFIPTGDVNSDGKFRISDLVMLQKWLLGVPNTVLADWQAADFFNDDKLDIFDLTLMRQNLINYIFKDIVLPDEYVGYSTTLIVHENGLKLYLGPDESYDCVASIPVRARIREMGYNKNEDKWLYTEYNGQNGWIKTVKEDGITPTISYEAVAAKPVIYLYPQQETNIHVELELTESELSTTYPKYNSGWDVTAYPDGKLVNKADGTHHNYLFWDAVNCRTRFDFSEGFCVAGNDTESFLKEKLTYMGLTEEEMNEFIVYWLPLMEHNTYNLISFQGDAYINSAKLNISPTPDSILRVFMAYIPLEEAIDVEPQQLETFERNGFTVVEWGGSEIKS